MDKNLFHKHHLAVENCSGVTLLKQCSKVLLRGKPIDEKLSPLIAMSVMCNGPWRPQRLGAIWPSQARANMKGLPAIPRRRHSAKIDVSKAICHRKGEVHERLSLAFSSCNWRSWARCETVMPENWLFHL